MVRTLLTVAVLALSASRIAAQDETLPPLTAQELVQGHREGYVIARPRRERQRSIDAEEAQEGTRPARVFAHLGAMRLIRLKPGETTADGLERLRATGRYDVLATDDVRYLYNVPNDPNFSAQWGLSNTGSNPTIVGLGVPGADIHALAAWDIRTDASNVVVAIVDTGLLLTHSDIAGNLWTNPRVGADGVANDLHGINAVPFLTTGDPNAVAAADVHGTHVAGIIGAIGNNQNDVTGIAWNVQLMPLKFISNTNSGSLSAELTCLNFAISHGANLINASFGSRMPNSAELAAVQAAGNADIIFVAAAGNDAEDSQLIPDFPSSYPVDNIICVAASDNRDGLARFSNFGSGTVDLAAPGDQIFSLYNSSNTATGFLSGTSMAAPMVTGALALLKAQFPGDNHRQLINRLLRHVDPNVSFTGRVQSGGRLNVQAALNSALADNTPFNDNFANRGHLAGSGLMVRASNAGATREAGEPLIAGNPGGASLWWDWTAPASGTLTLWTNSWSALTNTGGTVTTAGTAYQSLIGVYTGTSLAALTPVATSASGSITFAVVAGTTYELTVDAQLGQSPGLTILNLAFANNAFAAASALVGPSVGIVASTLGANRELGEPLILSNPGGSSLWYTWTAPKSGPCQISALSFDFDPLLAVYTGATLTALTLVGSNHGAAINTAAITAASSCTCTFNAVAGTTYRIAVDGTTEPSTQLSAGQFTLTIADSRWQGLAADAIDSAPSVAADGTVYVGSADSNFYAFNHDGTRKWSYRAAGPFLDAAAIAGDGTVYAGASDGLVYALNPAGTLKWSFPVANAVANGGKQAPVCSPTVASDGTIYIKDTADLLYALNPNGTLKWTFALPNGDPAGPSYAAPVLAPDGTLYLGSENGLLYALTPAGTVKWTFTAGSPIFTAAAIDPGGNLYFGTLGGAFYCVDSSGHQVWTYTASNSISSAPAIGANGSVYFASYDHNIYALNTLTGARQWNYALGGEVRACGAAIDGQGVIYIGCYDGKVYAINADGTLKRTYATGLPVRSSPAIFGTTLYVGSEDDRLYAFDLGAGAAGSPWPMYLNNSARLGRATSPALGIIVQPPPNPGLFAGSPIDLTVAATGQGPLSFQWRLNGAPIPGATNSTYLVTAPGPADYGTYTVAITGPQGTVTSNPSVVGLLAFPTGTASPLNQTVNTGATATLAAVATGNGLSYQWQFNNAAIAGATSATLTLPNVAATQAGAYTVVVSNLLGSAVSAPANLAVATAARLVNLSASATVGTGANNLIAGFTVANGTKKVLLRGIGPTLANFNVANVLATPTLTVTPGGSTTPLAANSVWGGGPALTAAFAQVSAFALPAGSADAALLQTLPAGTYSSGITGGTGVALAEIYDSDPLTAPSRLVNISARANAGAGAGVLTAGFVISGTTSETVLLRGIGPDLANFNIPGALAAPVLTLFDNQQNILASNSGWGNSPLLSSTFARVLAFALPANSNDAALLITLPPGNYSVQVTGVGAATGVALVEVYEVQ